MRCNLGFHGCHGLHVVAISGDVFKGLMGVFKSIVGLNLQCSRVFFGGCKKDNSWICREFELANYRGARVVSDQDSRWNC